MPVPNFFIVGASKAGTTALSLTLARHADIFMSERKEPNFFNQYDIPAAVIGEGEFQEYVARHFSNAHGSIVGEASVNYLASRRAAYWIHRWLPDAKVLIVVRNPMERTRSLFEMYVRHGYPHSFDHALRQDGFLLQHNLYAEAVRRFVECFPEEQLLVLDHADLRQDWELQIATLLRFLGVAAGSIDRCVETNQGGVPRHPALGFLTDRNLIRPLKKLLPSDWRVALDRYVKERLFARIEYTPDQMAYMTGHYREDVARLDVLLNSNFLEKWFAPQCLLERLPNRDLQLAG